MKVCTKCKTEQDVSCFYRCSKVKDGLEAECKNCRKERDVQNAKEIKIYKNSWYNNNKDFLLKKAETYRQNNQHERNLYEKNRRSNDLLYKLVGNLRNRLKTAIKNNYKSGSAIRDLGCSIEDLKLWLEQQFQPGMSWDNYGKNKEQWNIDHIIPLTRVDLTDRKQLKKVCHWFNLRPMWAKDNITKRNNIL